jgi:hypothetical protein
VDAERYVAVVRWQIASTMPEWPHEYTVKAWRPGLAELFETLSAYIRTAGTARPWPPPPGRAIYHNRYLDIGPHTYWAMGTDGDRGAIVALTVLNRTWSAHLAAAGAWACTDPPDPRWRAG